MNAVDWSYLLVIVGLLGFILVGRKIWWGWYINLAGQGLWITYAILTQQWGFLYGAIVYTAVFSVNSIDWTRTRFAPLWIGESSQARLTNIQARSAEEAAKKFKAVFQHEPERLFLVGTPPRHMKKEKANGTSAG